VATGASVLDAPRRGLATAATRRRASRRTSALDLLLLGALVATVAVIFVLVHRELVIQSDAAYTRVSGFPGSTHPGSEAFTYSFGPFSAVLLGSVALTMLRHRIAAFGIFILGAMTPLAQAALRVLPTDRGVGFRVAPSSLGIAWTSGYLHPGLGRLWRGFGIDYGLALLPAVAIAVWTLESDVRTGHPRPVAALAARVRMPTRSEAAGITGSFFLFWLFLHTWELRETLSNYGTSKIGADVVAFLPFFVFGIVLARGSRWRFLALAAIPILWSTQWIPTVIAGAGHGPSMNDVHDALPFVAVVVAGALWRPIASVVEGERTRSWVLVVALNALNIADVLFTKAALHSGQAVEANPFAAWIGPGVKLVGVGLASALLARFRPRALIWLVLIFGALIAWHLSGLILDMA
jgi:hypothetical protein